MQNAEDLTKANPEIFSKEGGKVCTIFLFYHLINLSTTQKEREILHRLALNVWLAEWHQVVCLEEVTLISFQLTFFMNI